MDAATGRVVCVGLATLDVIQYAERLPEPGTKGASEASWCGAGGPAANAAATVALLGGPVTLVAPVGADRPGAIARADLEGAGVALTVPASLAEVPTTVSSAWVATATGERTVLATGAGVDVDADADPPETALPPDAAAVLVDGFLPRLALAAARAARERDLPVVLDGGSWKPVHTELLPLVTHAICSARFAFPDDPGASTEARLERLAVVVGELAAITDGAAPVRYRRADAADAGGADARGAGAGAAGAITPPPPPAVVDTLGAGDVLHGSFAHHLAQRGRDPVAALAEAAADASASVAHRGTRAWAGRAAPAERAGR